MNPKLFILFTFLLFTINSFSQLLIDPFINILNKPRLYAELELEKIGCKKVRELSRDVRDVYKIDESGATIEFTYVEDGSKAVSFNIMGGDQRYAKDIEQHFNSVPNLSIIEELPLPEGTKVWRYCRELPSNKKKYKESIKKCNFRIILMPIHATAETRYKIDYIEF